MVGGVCDVPIHDSSSETISTLVAFSGLREEPYKNIINDKFYELSSQHTGYGVAFRR